MPGLLALTPNLTIDVLMNIPYLRNGEVHRAYDVRKVGGGKGINVARVARQLGKYTEIGGFLAGYGGQMAESHFKAFDLTGHFVWYEGELRNSIHLTEPGGRTTVINEDGGMVHGEHVIALTNRIREIRSRFDWIASSGSVPPDAPIETYVEMIQAMRPAKVAIDSHGRMLAMAVHQNVDFLHVNHLEAGDLLGRSLNTMEAVQEACADLYRMGNRHIVITLGEKGAVGYAGDQFWHVITPPIDVISDVGAGDGLFGAMIVGLMDNLPFVDVLRQGVASGAACCTVQEPGYLPMDIYQHLLAGAIVKSLP